ncbi:MAG: 16S rRNA (cytidine(1402)-2'-O)-methyltransferase [Candidatus Cloacimonadota bacterium]|nr:16S rRNA (cytidine(1402)-2'-O)-methyltransferase [Candidatus Cloacimonadota bacterium]
MLNSTLYVVATPIGNIEDITLRAIKILKQADIIICEDIKPGRRILSKLDIVRDYNKLIPLNEHTEEENTKLIFDILLTKDVKAALISDAGTPLFADPGNALIKKCNEYGLKVEPVPGASSLMATLMVSGIKLDKFLFYGFLPANKHQRISELKKLDRYKHLDLIFLEAPYRLKQLLRDFKSVLGKKREGIIFYKLTYPEQKIIFGNLKELSEKADNIAKGEFVFILKKKQG